MQTLEQWLDAATRGLSGSAATRVRAEIGEHYASALESAVAVGIDSIEAERRAVAELGDAKTANREYRRVLLTEREENLLRSVTWMSHRWQVLYMVLIAAVLIVIRFWIPVADYLLAWVVAEGVLRTIPISTIRAAWIVRISRWAVLASFYAASFASLKPMGALPGFMMLWIPLVTAYQEYKLCVIRRKLPVEQWPRRLWA
jgi:hypothetical protein